VYFQNKQDLLLANGQNVISIRHASTNSDFQDNELINQFKLHGPKRNDKSIQYFSTNSLSIIYFHDPHYKIIYEGVEVIMLVL